MAEKKQKMRYSDTELELIKATFAENEELLFAMRKLMLQIPMNAVELSLIELVFKGKSELLKIVRKAFLPELTDDVPLYQLIDLWMTVKIDDKSPAEASAHLLARYRLIAYINQQLIKLGDLHANEKILFSHFADIDNKPDVAVYSDMICRNTMITHTEQQLSMLSALAGRKDETLEQTKARLQKDSSK